MTTRGKPRPGATRKSLLTLTPPLRPPYLNSRLRVRIPREEELSVISFLSAFSRRRRRLRFEMRLGILRCRGRQRRESERERERERRFSRGKKIKEESNYEKDGFAQRRIERIKRFPEYACASCAIYARVQDNMSHVRATSRAIYSLAQRSKQQRSNKEIQRECVRDNFISRRKKQRLNVDWEM